MSYPVYCINLESRTDRKKHAEEQFKILNIDNVIYPLVTKDKRGGIYGCYDSHIKIWKDFYEKYPDINYCLIFEDDFVSTEKSKDYIKQGVEFINKNYNNVDILNLQNFDIPVENVLNNEYFTNGYGFALHAYFITRQYIDKISKNGTKFPEPNGKHIDNEVSLNIYSILYSEKIFFTKSVCFLQLVNESDNCDGSFFDSLSKININNTFDLNKKIGIIYSKLGYDHKTIKSYLIYGIHIFAIIDIIIMILLIILLYKILTKLIK